MKIKKDAFKGETHQHLNGRGIKPDVDKDTGEQLIGKSGTTKAWVPAGMLGTRVYLSDDQIEE